MCNSELGTHPEDYFNNVWDLFKGLFIITFLVLIIMDFFAINIFNITSFVVIRTICISMIIISFVALMVMERHWNKKKATIEFENNISTTEFNEWFDLYKFADGLYHQRFNFFMVAESMLIVSFTTSLVPQSIPFVISFAIALLGLVFTFSWAYVNRRFDFRIMWLNDEKLQKYENYKKYLKCLSLKSIPTGFFLTNLLPTATFFFWYFLLHYTWYKMI
jgi:hypothetical protein